MRKNRDELFSFSVSNLSFDEVYQIILKNIQANKKTILFPLNIHSLRLVNEDKSVKKDFQNADIVFPDGIPIIWLLKFIDKPTKERVSGTELVEKLLQTPSLRIFLLGSTPATLKKINKLYRGKKCANIVGMYSPSFKHFYASSTQRAIQKKINTTKPIVLLVALGQPKQEKWLTKHFHSLPSIVGVGIGSALEILSNEKPRAPTLLRDYGFEWLWRILLEPKRLVFRYANDLLFLKHLVLKSVSNKN